MFKNKTILVTGGAGSIGSQFSEDLLKDGFKGTLLVFDRSENNLVFLKERLRGFQNCNFILGDILDVNKLEFIFNQFNINMIIHCAAYKQVPFMQNNVYELVRNNIEGLLNVLTFAKIKPIEKFLFISTDKAVYPNNYMGMSKRIGEMLVEIENNLIEKSNYCSLRFGNILNSSGSVLKLFEMQWNSKSKIYITDANAKRFFVNTSDVYKYIKNVLKQNNKHSLYIGDFSEEKKLIDLAKEFLKNKNVNDPHSYIEFIGLRDGDKLTEKLRYDFEEFESITNSNIKVIISQKKHDIKLKERVQDLIKINTPFIEEKVRKALGLLLK